MTNWGPQVYLSAAACILFGLPAAATCPESSPQLVPADEVAPLDCHVLMEPIHPELEGANQPICEVVLRYLSSSCRDSFGYTFAFPRAVDGTLNRPAWSEVDISSHSELIKQTYLASTLPEYREGVWQYGATAVEKSVALGTLRLWRADLGDSLNGALQTVYKVESVAVGEKTPENSWSRMMFSEREREVPSPLLSPLSYLGTGDLVRSKSSWFLLEIHSEDAWLAVKELMRPQGAGDSPIAAVTRCRIQKHQFPEQDLH